MPDVKVTIQNKDRKIGAMVKALAFEVGGPKSVSGTTKEFLEKNGFYIFHFSSQEYAAEFMEALAQYLPGLLATTK